MRLDSDALISAHSNESVEPRYVVIMSLDTPPSDLIYLTSHDDCDLPPGATPSNTFRGVLTKIQSTSQKLDPVNATSTIGSGSFGVLDVDNELSSYLRGKWLDSKSTTRKIVNTYVGAYGLEFSEYSIISSKLKFNHEYDGLTYTFFLEDAQRSVKKDIHEQKKTTLYESITKDQTAFLVTSINTIDSNDFEMCWHDNNFTDAPGETVGYLLIKDGDNVEIARYSDILSTEMSITSSDVSFSSSDFSVNSPTAGLSVFAVGQLVKFAGTASNNISAIVKTSSETKLTLYDLDGVSDPLVVTESAGPSVSVTAQVQVYNVVRGRLGTRRYAVEVDSTLDADRKPALIEHIYIETTLLKIAYATLTGEWYGTANALPSNWHLNIDSSYVDVASFIDKTDLWDVYNDAGKIYRFNGLKKSDGKMWLNKQVCLPASCFMRVLNNGSIGLFRFQRVSHNSAHVAHLSSADDLISFGSIKYDDAQIRNVFSVDWNYEPEKETTTRNNTIVDQDSYDMHLESYEPINVTLDGLHGSRGTVKDLRDTFDWLRDAYSGPPVVWQVKAMFRWNRLEVGDVIRVTHDDVYDITNDVNTYVDRCFMILGKTIDWQTGGVTLNLFGSTQSAGAISWDDSTTYQLSDAFFGSVGTNLDTISGASLVGSVLHQTTNCTLAGDADMNASAAVYYSLTDYELNADVIATYTHNTQLRIKGHLQASGLFLGSGQGLNPDSAGWIGTTKGGGSFNITYRTAPGSGDLVVNLIRQTDQITIDGTYTSVPHLNLQNDAGVLSGLPSDMRPTSGCLGASLKQDGAVLVPGATAPAGSAALVIICRGMSFGASGSIDSSGYSGGKGIAYKFYGAYLSTMYGEYSPGGNNIIPFSLTSGASGASYPGPVVVVVDGAASVKPGNNLVADFPASPTGGGRLYTAGVVGGPGWVEENLLNKTTHSNYIPHGGIDCSDSCWRVIPAPSSIAPVADQQDTADTPVAFSSVVETQNSPSTVSQNLSSVQINLTPPADTNYQYSNVYYKLNSQSDSEYTLVGPALNSVSLPPTTMNGATYDVIAKPVSKKGIESPDYIHTTVTVSSATGGANMSDGNYIAIGQSAYNTGVGAWIEKITSGVRASFGNSGSSKLLINTDSASVVEIIGKATIDEGTVGGWTLSSTYLTSGSGANTVRIDSGGINPAISIGSATPASAPFRVTQAGALVATSVTISGSVTTTDGETGGWTVGSTYLTSGSGANTVRIDSGGINPAVSAGSATPASAPFRVTQAGALVATSATISGHMPSSTIQSCSFLTSGSFLTAAATAADSTLYVYDTSDFATSGSGQIVDGTNDRDAFSWTGKTSTTLTGCSGVLAHTDGASVVSLSVNSTLLISNETNDMRFYGDRGDGTLEELSAIGITQIGSGYAVGKFGSTSAGTDRVGLYALSYENYGAVVSSSSTTVGALKITPKSDTTDPTAGEIGSFYVRSDGVLMFHDGTSWKTITVV